MDLGTHKGLLSLPQQSLPSASTSLDNATMSDLRDLAIHALVQLDNMANPRCLQESQQAVVKVQAIPVPTTSIGILNP